MAAPQLQLFGVAGWQGIVFADDKRFRLLAYLASQEDWVSREQLSYLFWSETDSQSARKNLRHLLGRTKTLKYDLEIELEHLRWNVQTDVALFRQAIRNQSWAEALRLYTGQFLAGFGSDDSPEFTAWLLAERLALSGLRRGAVLAQAGFLHQSNQTKDGLGLLETLFVTDPLDEEALELYLQIAAQAGQQSAALRCYQNFTEHLELELGLPPPRHLEHLAVGLRQGLVQGRATAVTTVVRPNTLPALLTAFVGREMLMAELSNLFSLRQQRLVTLVGAGGVGKTRMALQFTHEQQKVCEVVFVRLVPLENPNVIPNAIAEGLGLVFFGSESPIVQVAQFIGDKKLLLVLDNFEHLLAGAVHLGQLLQDCPNLMLLTTSREPLGLVSEQLLAVEAFYLPETLKPEEIHSLEAVQLFIQHAKRVKADFTTDQNNLPLILEICRLVDGLALGIELAAVWVRSLDLSEIAAEIAKNLDFLVSSSPDRTERHRSIRAVFEYSWNLLTHNEQQALKSLSVFRNGFSKEAGQLVGETSVVVLSSLTDKSLFSLTQEGRYRRHRLLHQFMSQKLLEQPKEAQIAYKKHAQYYFRVLQLGLENIRFGNSKAALETLELEFENIGAAWQWAIQNQQLHLLKTAAEALMRFFDARGRCQEAIEMFAKAIDVVQDPATLGTLLIHQAKFFERLGQFQLSQRQTERGLALLADLEERETMIWGLGNLGTIATSNNDHQSAILHRRAALIQAEALGNERLRAVCLGWVAISEDLLENFSAAETHYLEAIGLFRQLHNQIGELYNLNGLAAMLSYQEQHQEALKLFLAAYELAKKAGELTLSYNISASIAICYQSLEQPNEAFLYTKEALEQSLSLNTQNSLQIDWLIRLFQLSEDNTHLQEALKMAWSRQDLPRTLTVFLEYAKQPHLPAKLVGSLLQTVAQHPKTLDDDRTIALALLEKRTLLNSAPQEITVLVQQIRLLSS